MRRYKRSFKNNFFGLFLIIVFCISVGYAVMNRTLNITGNSEVKQNTWNIYFDNVQVKDGSVTANTPVIDTTTKSTVNFNVMLNLPGDFYEFTVDVVNNGTIDAMLEGITKTPDLSEAQAKYLKYIIEYQNGEQLAAKQLVKKEEFVRLKVRVEYRKDLNAEDLPTTSETLNLAFSVNYVQADETGIVVNDSGATKQLIEFTIDGITYQAEEGMTWGEWIDSEYNTSEFYIKQNCGIDIVWIENKFLYNTSPIEIAATIDNTISYVTELFVGSCGDGGSSD